MSGPDPVHQAIVIGGGAFGCALALELRRHVERVLVLEKEPDVLQRASLVNQARVHQGYHYPRSLLTAARSRLNYPRFVHDYRSCIDSSVHKYYGIARQGSRVSAKQFEIFCQRIGAPLAEVPASIGRLFDARLVERVFATEEVVFDAVKLRARLLSDMRRAGIELELGCEALAVTQDADGPMRVAAVQAGSVRRFQGRHVFNCTYARTNQLLAASRLPTIPLKHELTEMALVEVPEAYQGLGITLMDGPFFSLMPYPSRGLHTLSHVRYTPHHAWEDDPRAPFDPHRYLQDAPKHSRFPHMIKDVARYMPGLAEARYVESLWEVKTVLPKAEGDDSRPILFRAGHGLPNLVCVLGGKIDNVFDVLEEVQDRVQGGWLQ